MGDLHVIDVGHGNCAICRGDGWAAMIDAPAGATALDGVRDLGLRHLDLIVISHRDYDHCGGVVPILADQELGISKIFIPSDAAKDPGSPENALLLVALEEAKRSGRCEVSRNLDAALPSGELDGGGVALEVLAPTFAAAMTGVLGKGSAGGKITSNSVSAVIRVGLPGGLRILLSGDIDDAALAELRDSDSDLRADVLVFPHHGAHSAVADEEAFARDVMEAVRPHTVLFSVGRGKRSRPTEAVLRGVFGSDPGVYVACTQLSSGCASLDVDLAADPEMFGHLGDVAGSGHPPRCRSCAGTMLIEGDGLSRPSQEAHQRFIDKVPLTPMCRTLRETAAG
jgi:beta-lactamase superfamily II metal-dependent hydrolase